MQRPDPLSSQVKGNKEAFITFVYGCIRVFKKNTRIVLSVA